MKREIPDFPLRYQKLLKSFLSDGGEMNPDTAEELGTHAHSCGLKTLDLFKLHDRIVVADILPECPPGRQATLSRRASRFFSAVIAAGESPQDPSTETLRLKKVIRDLSRQMVDLSGSNHGDQARERVEIVCES
jgi:hypothetical protein